MESKVIIDDIEYDLLNKEPIIFVDVKSLCKNGWKIATILELKKLNETLSIFDDKIN